MHNGWRVVPELGLGVLRARGADAASFLQGQLSNDVTRLQPGRLQLSGYHTPQGRTIAVLRLTLLAAGDVLAILPRELVPSVTARLRRYVLRAKVQITDDSDQWAVAGYQGPEPVVPPGSLSLAHGNTRHFVLSPAPAVSLESCGVAGTADDWTALDVAEGLPQVFETTSEAFVAQMLNLDVTGGIALDKGCYTGQEIIARAHYRGQVKRRMQRFESDAAIALKPGQTGMLGDGRSFKVVLAAPGADGRCEFLAVTNPAPGTEEVTADVAADAQTHVLIAARQLALPYDLPALRS